MIYILIGADGSGKTTTAQKFMDKYKASYIHATYNKNMDVFKHHENIMNFVAEESQWQDFVVDRFSPCEYAYGNVYRDGESFDTVELMRQLYSKAKDKPVLIYCNPTQNKYGIDGREEMFENKTTELNKYYKEWLDKAGLPYLEYDWQSETFEELEKRISDLITKESEHE